MGWSAGKKESDRSKSGWKKVKEIQQKREVKKGTTIEGDDEQGRNTTL